MNVLNDKPKAPPTGQGKSPIALLLYGLYCAFGIASVLFAPLPMIISHIRLSEPWSKLAALIGAAFALLFFKVSLFPVLGAFIFGLFVADGVRRSVPFWKLVTQSLMVATVFGSVVIFFRAQQENMTMWVFWQQVVENTLVKMEGTLQVADQGQWEVVRAVFLYEGPFIYLSAALLSLWFSVAAAAHFDWLPNMHQWGRGRLRKIQFPKWLSGAFILLFAGVLYESSRDQHLFGGPFRLVSTLMFIQGSIFLSELLSYRKMPPRMRTVVYVVAVILGFYALMGIGVVRPWLQRKDNFRKWIQGVRNSDQKRVSLTEMEGSNESHS